MKKTKKWIDIKKKVPDKSDDYLVCDRNGVMFVCAYYPEEKRWFINGVDGPYYSEDGYLRFWMELPDMPVWASSISAAILMAGFVAYSGD